MSEQVREEFGRQAALMATAPAFSEARTLCRITEALGPAPLGRVLEVACGPGIVAEAIAPLVSELVCIDATPEMLALAKARVATSRQSNVTFQQAYAEDLPFADGAFDVIVTRLSFHHFADIPAVLAEFQRVLRQAGRLVVADIITSPVPDESRLHNALEQLRDPTHVHMFSRPEIEAVLLAGGFRLLSGESWEQPRSFAEWAKIVAVPGRTKPLHEIMLTLARAGLKAGIDLNESGAGLEFTHTWLLVAAEAMTAPEV